MWKLGRNKQTEKETEKELKKLMKDKRFDRIIFTDSDTIEQYTMKKPFLNRSITFEKARVI